MIDEFMKELKFLQNLKKQNEHLIADKEVMSEMLYKFMLEKYESTDYETRRNVFIKETCSCCKYRDNNCNTKFDDDILKPIPSIKGCIPSKKGCMDFEWA
jgi:hypothetical protein